ncbi:MULTISPECIES: hypothetical protein [Marinobacter]|uniref:hypothetical protein n=1 Tax=Marinobacter TaxID=2742 RepID=UPI000DADEC3C|nr:MULTISPECIES: hypothetical protein [Marinobacter]
MKGQWRQYSKSVGAMAGLLAAALGAHAQDTPLDTNARTTMQTIPFESLDAAGLADTAIEGGLAAPAAGPSSASASPEDDYYLDPLALQPRDERTDLGRYEIPAEIRFSTPKEIPGQTRGSNYVIRPPQNRSYDALNTRVQGR